MISQHEAQSYNYLSMLKVIYIKSRQHRIIQLRDFITNQCCINQYNRSCAIMHGVKLVVSYQYIAIVIDNKPIVVY